MIEARILIIDDSNAVLSTLRLVLKSEFSTVAAVSDPQLIPALISAGNVDVVLLDMNFGLDKLDGQDGIFWLDRIINRSGLENPPAVVMITAFADVNLAVQTLKNGASDFIQKPWDNNDLIHKLTEAVRKRSLKIAEKNQPQSEKQEQHLTLDEIECQSIKQALESAGHNLTEVADMLGISRQTLYNKMKRYDIN